MTSTGRRGASASPTRWTSLKLSLISSNSASLGTLPTAITTASTPVMVRGEPEGQVSRGLVQDHDLAAERARIRQRGPGRGGDVNYVALLVARYEIPVGAVRTEAGGVVVGAGRTDNSVRLAVEQKFAGRRYVERNLDARGLHFVGQVVDCGLPLAACWQALDEVDMAAEFVLLLQQRHLVAAPSGDRRRLHPCLSAADDHDPLDR